MMDKLKKLLDLIATGAFIVLCCVAIFWFVENRIERAPRQASGIAVGDAMPEVLPIEYEAHDRTLILVLSADCRFCVESTPFYKSLVESLQDTSELREEVQVVAVVTEDEDTSDSFISSAGLQEIPLFSGVKLRNLRVRGTPTLLLVDRQGIVVNLWRGKLVRGAEQEVLKALTG
ncbi:MAG: hypothetical protein F4X39_02525 [Acidobacteriia bacterium]|nr:hypothetical protein [Terriglobia bacterium]